MHCSIAHTENLAVSEMTKSMNCCMRRFFLSPPFIRRPPSSHFWLSVDGNCDGFCKSATKSWFPREGQVKPSLAASHLWFLQIVFDFPCFRDYKSHIY